MSEPAIKPVDNSKDISAFLDGVKAEKYDSVIVIGYKDGTVQTKSSRYEDWTILMGALGDAAGPTTCCGWGPRL